MPSDTFNNPVVFTSAVTLGAGLANTLPRSSLTQQTLVPYPVRLTDLRIWNAFDDPLTGTAGTDDLALVGNTFGTGSPSVQTSDGKAASITQYARFTFSLPAEYEAAETVVLRSYAGMKTTVSDTSAALDFEVYKSDKYAGIGTDICATSATSINAALLSASPAPKDFTITASTLSPGDVLDVRVSIAIVDGATGTAVIGEIGGIEFLLDIRG